MKKVLFISSTGGHLNELLKLEPIFKDYDYHVITEKDKSTEYLKKIYINRIDFLPYCTRSKIVSYIFLYTILIFKSLILFFKIYPDVIITTGTHTAVPMCYIGKLFRKKIIYIETLANINRRTLTGKIVYPIANLFIVQWKKMLKLYPKAIYVGDGGTNDIGIIGNAE